MSAANAVEKVSLTIDVDVLSAARERVPRGGLSAYTTSALRRQIERDGLGDIVFDYTSANGPLDESAVEAHMAAWK